MACGALIEVLLRSCRPSRREYTRALWGKTVGLKIK
jgi:hypothetical protein